MELLKPSFLWMLSEADKGEGGIHQSVYLSPPCSKSPIAPTQASHPSLGTVINPHVIKDETVIKFGTFKTLNPSDSIVTSSQARKVYGDLI